jgi:hypothetical protein
MRGWIKKKMKIRRNTRRKRATHVENSRGRQKEWRRQRRRSERYQNVGKSR